MLRGVKITAIIAIIILTVLLGQLKTSSSGVQTDNIFSTSTYLSFDRNYDNFEPKGSNKGFNSAAMYDDRITNFNELKATSSTIYEVTLISRTQYEDMVEAKVKISKVYKDTDNIHKANDIIYFFERCYGIDISLISTKSTLLPMKKEQKYVVFLNEIPAYVEHKRYNLSTLMYSIIPVKEKLSILSISDEKVIEINSNKKVRGFDYQYVMNYDLVHFLQNTLDLNAVKEQSDLELSDFPAEAGENYYNDMTKQIKDRVINAKYSLAYFDNYKQICEDALKQYYNFTVIFNETSYSK